MTLPLYCIQLASQSWHQLAHSLHTALHTSCTQLASSSHTACIQLAHSLHTSCAQLAYILGTACIRTVCIQLAQLAYSLRWCTFCNATLILLKALVVLLRNQRGLLAALCLQPSTPLRFLGRHATNDLHHFPNSDTSETRKQVKTRTVVPLLS